MLKVAVLMGGRSGEHEVSLQSSRYIVDSLGKAGYPVTPIGITPEGRWLHHPDILRMLEEGSSLEEARPVKLDLCYQGQGLLVDDEPLELDLVFPVLHGPFGEDGTVQGLLETAGIPYVGAGVLGSALAMDKVQMKVAFRAKNLPVGSYLSFYSWEWENGRRELSQRIEERLGMPVFIKPANLGSSVGISKASSMDELLRGVEEALKYDSKVIVEAAISGREIECSVLGNENPRASIPGEIIPSKEFYDYEAKYLDNKSRLVIPAQLSQPVTERVRELAIDAFLAVEARGLARVDMFVKSDGTVYLNEINTMPGFTAISMYPKLWEASGVSGPELVHQLVELGMGNYWRRSRLSYKHRVQSQ